MNVTSTPFEVPYFRQPGPLDDSLPLLPKQQGTKVNFSYSREFIALYKPRSLAQAEFKANFMESYKSFNNLIIQAGCLS